MPPVAAALCTAVFCNKSVTFATWCAICLLASGEKANLWAFNFFFYNKKMKRILYIGVKAVSKLAADDEKVCKASTLVASIRC